MFQTLLQMYPVHIYEDIQGFSNWRFSSWVLIPEITTQLIEEDMQLTKEEVMKVLEEHFDYGNTLFADVDKEELKNWLVLQHNEHPWRERRKKFLEICGFPLSNWTVSVIGLGSTYHSPTYSYQTPGVQ